MRLNIVPAMGDPEHPGRNQIQVILGDSSIAKSGILVCPRNVAVDACRARAAAETFIDSRLPTDMMESGLALSRCEASPGLTRGRLDSTGLPQVEAACRG